MDKNIGLISKRLMVVLGLALVLASPACGDKKLAERAPARALEATAPNPASEKSAGAGGVSAVDHSRKNVPGWWF